MVVEASLDGILVAQEAGDLVSVLPVRSAGILPDDTQDLDFCRSKAWFGVWLDRDSAGDKGVTKWITSTSGHADHPDGGLITALGATGADIRPSGDGKMDPGDCYQQGLSIREHIMSHLPRAWRKHMVHKSAESTFAPGGVVKGGGGPDPEGQVQELAWSVKELGRLLSNAPVVCRYSDDEISIRAYARGMDGRWVRDDDGRLIPAPDWELTHWDHMREASRLFWHDGDVQEFLENHPDAARGISGKNFWAGMARK